MWRWVTASKHIYWCILYKRLSLKVCLWLIITILLQLFYSAISKIILIILINECLCTNINVPTDNSTGWVICLSCLYMLNLMLNPKWNLGRNPFSAMLTQVSHLTPCEPTKCLVTSWSFFAPFSARGLLSKFAFNNKVTFCTYHCWAWVSFKKSFYYGNSTPCTMWNGYFTHLSMIVISFNMQVSLQCFFLTFI